MSDESYFITDAVAGLKLENVFISYQRLKNQKNSVTIGLYCFGGGGFMNFLMYNLLKQFFHIPNCTMCLSKEILYQYFILFIYFFFFSFFCPALDKLGD